MTMTRPDPICAVASAEANLQRLLDQREAALDGKGLSPRPASIAAAEIVLEEARERMRKAVAA